MMESEPWLVSIIILHRPSSISFGKGAQLSRQSWIERTLPSFRELPVPKTPRANQV